MGEFIKSMMGQKFFEKDVVSIAKSLEKIANELKRANDIIESEKLKNE